LLNLDIEPKLGLKKRKYLGGFIESLEKLLNINNFLIRTHNKYGGYRYE
jgi:hypothetical protein